jgi:hypothetical protein
VSDLDRTHDIELPRVSPVGILERPDGFEARPRTYPRAIRALATAMLVVFLLVLIATTLASLGRYCLTSDGNDLRALPGRFLGGTPDRGDLRRPFSSVAPKKAGGH